MVKVKLVQKQIRKVLESLPCKCDLTEGGYGLCYKHQWFEGVIDDMQVVRDLDLKLAEKLKD